jgi:hypothetical protein
MIRICLPPAQAERLDHAFRHECLRTFNGGKPGDNAAQHARLSTPTRPNGKSQVIIVRQEAAGTTARLLPL